MKAPLPRHERIGSRSTLCVFILVAILASASALGGVRLYGLHLEHRLADITKRIEETNSFNSGMEEQYSALLSPSRIYTYAKVELNMTTAKGIETIRIRDGAEAPRLADASRTAVDDAQAPGGLLSFFIGRANAKN